MSETRLLNTFNQFAQFGLTKVQVGGTIEMDNVRFAKLCREAKLIGKTLTSVDVDIIFKQALAAKTDRKLGFPQFRTAVALLAEKKFPKDAQALDKLVALLSRAAPESSGTVAIQSGIVGKLTDTSLYTGSHKERFDADGKGRGLEGRETAVKTADLSQIVERKSAPVKRPVTVSMDQLQAKSAAAPKKAWPTTLPASKAVSKSSVSISKPALPKSSSGSVYDRLTDTKSYTGTHKERFDATGKGRGLAGRETISNKDLSGLVARRP